MKRARLAPHLGFAGSGTSHSTKPSQFSFFHRTQVVDIDVQRQENVLSEAEVHRITNETAEMYRELQQKEELEERSLQNAKRLIVGVLSSMKLHPHENQGAQILSSDGRFRKTVNAAVQLSLKRLMSSLPEKVFFGDPVLRSTIPDVSSSTLSLANSKNSEIQEGEGGEKNAHQCAADDRGMWYSMSRKAIPQPPRHVSTAVSARRRPKQQGGSLLITDRPSTQGGRSNATAVKPASVHATQHDEFFQEFSQLYVRFLMNAEKHRRVAPHLSALSQKVILSVVLLAIQESKEKPQAKEETEEVDYTKYIVSTKEEERKIQEVLRQQLIASFNEAVTHLVSDFMFVLSGMDEKIVAPEPNAQTVEKTQRGVDACDSAKFLKPVKPEPQFKWQDCQKKKFVPRLHHRRGYQSVQLEPSQQYAAIDPNDLSVNALEQSLRMIRDGYGDQLREHSTEGEKEKKKVEVPLHLQPTPSTFTVGQPVFFPVPPSLAVLNQAIDKASTKTKLPNEVFHKLIGLLSGPTNAISYNTEQSPRDITPVPSLTDGNAKNMSTVNKFKAFRKHVMDTTQPLWYEVGRSGGSRVSPREQWKGQFDLHALSPCVQSQIRSTNHDQEEMEAHRKKQEAKELKQRYNAMLDGRVFDKKLEEPPRVDYYAKRRTEGNVERGSEKKRGKQLMDWLY